MSLAEESAPPGPFVDLESEAATQVNDLLQDTRLAGEEGAAAAEESSLADERKAEETITNPEAEASWLEGSDLLPEPEETESETMTQADYEEHKRKNNRRGRRMSQVERDVDDIFATCAKVQEKSTRQRRKSMELRAEAADCVKRMSALIEMGTTMKVVTGAAKWKKKADKFKHTETHEDKHVKHMHHMEAVRQFGSFTGTYEGHTTCFVCDCEVTAEDIKQSLCPVCNTVLNHTTIKCTKKPRSTTTTPASSPAVEATAAPTKRVSEIIEGDAVVVVKGFTDILSAPEAPITGMASPAPN